jgi:hypothetical protein
VKDILGRFGLTEFLTIVCPGLFLLLSFAVWAPRNVLAALWAKPDTLESIGVAIILVLVAYTLGMVVNAIAAECWMLRLYVFDYAAMLHHSRRLLQFVTWVLWLFQGSFDFPLQATRGVETLMTLGGRFADLSGGEDRLPRSPFELVSAFRVFVSGQLDRKWRALSEQTEDVNRRRVFAQGTSLVLLLAAIQCVVRGLGAPYNDGVHVTLLSAAAAILVASFGLRLAAARLWEQELLYTYRVYLLVTPGAGWAAGA